MAVTEDRANRCLVIHSLLPVFHFFRIAPMPAGIIDSTIFGNIS
jgi:hypothetical protein